MGPEELIFIHLSDIHFRQERSGTVFDVDADIRNELKNDAKNRRDEIGAITGVLVTGDIAFAANEDEYKRAVTWLQELCDNTQCSLEDVRVVPGNHDVNRGLIANSSAIQDRHEKFRRISPNEIDLELQRYMMDEFAKESIFEPLNDYNAFASIFTCQISADKPFWQDDLVLNDGSILRLRGLNSTLISNSFDDDGSNKLILGTVQAAAPTEDGVEYLTLCHHPLQWLRDQDEVERYLDARVKIQLFGHKHRFRVDQGIHSVAVSAGAMHPDKREPNWQPRYNLISIHVDNKNGGRKLRVRIRPRVWNDNEKTFTAELNRNDSPYYESSFELAPWSLPARVEAVPPTVPARDSEPPPPEMSEKLESQEGRPMNRNRRLTYRFYTLPYNVRLRVAQELDLVKDEDRDVPDTKLFNRYFQRAQEKKALELLWNTVEKAHDDKRFPQNPFTGE